MCELCSYRTSTGSELRNHIENKHTAVDRFKYVLILITVLPLVRSLILHFL